MNALLEVDSERETLARWLIIATTVVAAAKTTAADNAIMVSVVTVVAPIKNECPCSLESGIRSDPGAGYACSIHDDVFAPLQGSDVYRSSMKQDTQDHALATLMQAAQGGDKHAYARLLQELVSRLRRIIRRERPFLRTEDVEDLAQDVLLSLHVVRATYDPQRPFMPWLIGIMRNRLADGARRYARRVAHEVQTERLPVTFFDDGANMDKGGYYDPEALRQAIRELPPGQRQAIEMLKLHEMSLKQAAAVSGTSTGALKVSVHRAMASLRKALAKKS